MNVGQGFNKNFPHTQCRKFILVITYLNVACSLYGKHVRFIKGYDDWQVSCHMRTLMQPHPSYVRAILITIPRHILYSNCCYHLP